MRTILLLGLAAAALNGAVIRGSVVENQTGRPLARALVALDPVRGTQFTRQTLRSTRYGTFEFQNVPAGSYILTASREGFVTTEYGQKQWNSSGVPLVVAADDSPSVMIRLPHFGAITGTVLDENDVGLPEHEVVAFRNTRPPQLVTRAKSDDRGIFRLYGLEPGSYLIRSVWKLYEDGGYLPTFGKETELVDQAYSFDVNYDQQIDRADLRPIPGRLYTLDVEAVPVVADPLDPTPVTMILASEMGRETVQGAKHRFGPMPPGTYELFAQAPLGRAGGIQGEYQRIVLAGDMNLRMMLRQVPEIQFTLEGVPDQAIDSGAVQILARRKDVAGDAPAQPLKLVKHRTQLAAGPWELALAPSQSVYAASFSGPRYQRPGDGRADGWNEILVGIGSPQVRFTISSSPGTVHGVVKSGSDPLPGAPVFLEPFDLEPHRRLTDPFVTRTDTQGQYRFSGLAPGMYRVLSSFDYKSPDTVTMTAAGARPIRVDAAHDLQQDLDLYVVH